MPDPYADSYSDSHGNYQRYEHPCPFERKLDSTMARTGLCYRLLNFVMGLWQRAIVEHLWGCIRHGLFIQLAQHLTILYAQRT